MNTSAAISLTPMDVERLLNDDSPESRTSVLEKISQGYNGEQFHGRERDIAEQIFRFLMKDVALRVRVTLAERLQHNTQVPRDIVLHMANDVESVAVPVLSNSGVLSDADLVNIVEQSQDMGKLVAIAKRPTVSLRVSDALVETRYAQVMTSLISNEGATISARSLEKIVEDFSNNGDIIEALSRKPKLPITVVDRIIVRASAQVAQELREKYKITEMEATKDTSAAREDFMLRLLDGELSHEEIVALVKQMAVDDRLTPSIVMTALCRGQLYFFTVALAQFSSIPISNAQVLLDDKGGHGFNGLYAKSGLPESMMDAIRMLVRAVQDLEELDDIKPGTMHYADRLTERVISLAGNQQIEYLPYFIALIRQNVRRPQ
jgi:uncharacterized protein (DUF2336 family)